ncbi:hypothetical protein D3C78_1102200 [compost metagenome]
MLGKVSRHARGVWLAQGQRTRTGFHQQAVRVAVVAAFKLDDFIAVGVAARQTNGAHGGFGPRVHHAYHIHGRHQFGDQLRHFNFHLGRGAKAQAALRRFDDRVADRRVVVPQYHWAPGTDVVDIGFAVDVEQVSPVRPFDKQRHTANAVECTHRRVNPAWDYLFCLGIQTFGLAV